jgi:hypothetical protein
MNMETIATYRAQYCKFGVALTGQFNSLFSFRVTFNSPDGDMDMAEVARQCEEQVTDAMRDNEVVAECFAKQQLMVLADWLCRELFESSGVGVSVDVFGDAGGAVATYGAMTTTSVPLSEH